MDESARVKVCAQEHSVEYWRDNEYHEIHGWLLQCVSSGKWHGHITIQQWFIQVHYH